MFSIINRTLVRGVLPLCRESSRCILHPHSADWANQTKCWLTKNNNKNQQRHYGIYWILSSLRTIEWKTEGSKEREKYLDLARELKRLWTMKLTVIPVASGASKNSCTILMSWETILLQEELMIHRKKNQELVLLFNGISTFTDYLIPNPSFEKNNSCTIQPIAGTIRQFMPFPRVFVWKWTQYRDWSSNSLTTIPQVLLWQRGNRLTHNKRMQLTSRKEIQN